MKKIIILIVSLCLSACGVNTSSNNDQYQKYGEKVSYVDGKELKFPDFSVKFSGKREIPNTTGNPALRFIAYDFLVTKGDKTQTVSWSSGTGDIAPRYFNVEGTDFVLEVGMSDVIKGALGEGNLVIWEKSEFEKAKGKK